MKQKNGSIAIRRGSYRLITALLVCLLFVIAFSYIRYGGEAALLFALYGSLTVTVIALMSSTVLSILEEQRSNAAAAAAADAARREVRTR